jgi:glycosyltransferase involved in cell wall biosynthesis
MRENRVCVIIPAYNEEKVVGKVIKDVEKQFKKSGINFTILVVDDGSTDSTHEVAKKSKATVVKHILNSGAGGATATGIHYAHKHGYDIAVTMDADGQHHTKDVINGVKLLMEKDVDLLIGSRLIDYEGMSKVKVLGNRGLSLVTRVLFGIKSSDSQSGLRVFSKRSLEHLRWKTTGYEFCSEMLWRAKQLGLSIGEYPIQAIYTDYSKAKGQNNWNAINIVKRLLKRRIVELLG